MTEVALLTSDQITALLETAMRRVLAEVRDASPPSSHVTIHEAAQTLRRSTKTVLRYVKLGKLEASKVAGGNSPVMISRASIQRLLELTAV